MLAQLWMDADDRIRVVECRHFFSGAAAYRDGRVAATLTPAGLAFSGPAEVRDKLLNSGQAVPLHYFPRAPVKRDSVVFPSEPALDVSAAVRLILGHHLQPD